MQTSNVSGRYSKICSDSKLSFLGGLQSNWSFKLMYLMQLDSHFIKIIPLFDLPQCVRLTRKSKSNMTFSSAPIQAYIFVALSASLFTFKFALKDA